MGFFSKRRVTLYEVEKDIELSDQGRSSFTFSIPSEINEQNVVICFLLQDRLLFRIPMPGMELLPTMRLLRIADLVFIHPR